MTTLLRGLLIFTTFVVIYGEPGVKMGTVKFYDPFGDEVIDMVYTGGFIEIECQIVECSLMPEEVQLFTGWWKISPVVVETKVCEKNVVFRFEITENIKFKPYFCKYGEHISAEHFDLKYRFCSPLDAACSEVSSNDGPEQCIYLDSDRSNPSVRTDEDFDSWNCMTTGMYFFDEVMRSSDRIKYCGAETSCGLRQPYTLCQALVQGRLRKVTTKVYDPNVTASCMAVGQEMGDPEGPIERAGLPYPIVQHYTSSSWMNLRFNEIITVRNKHSTVITVPDRYLEEAFRLVVNCTIKRRDGTLAHTDMYWTKDFVKTVFLNPFENLFIFNPKTTEIDIYKYQCQFRKRGGDILLAETSAFLIPESGTALIKLTNTLGGTKDALSCEPPHALPPRFVIQRHVWSTELNRPGAENLEGPVIIPKYNGTYRCQIEVKVACNKGSNEKKYDILLVSESYTWELEPTEPDHLQQHTKELPKDNTSAGDTMGISLGVIAYTVMISYCAVLVQCGRCD